MAVSIRSQDVREKIIKEGVLRYRQSSLYLQRWKPRYVVFKITHSGRLQLIVYKDQPAIPVNEIKEIPIDEFGGLVSNLSLDNEKFAFAVITTGITESFSSESPHIVTEWTSLLQEYLGKELVLNISIPTRQHLLKAGRAQLRVRNTGFTITTCDNPPRCQGTWQIIHIRKYGGSDSFRFQTGSKCPTGEFLYTIQTDDNIRLKSLFYDLSQHRPIFTDDRVGRRMTLERSFNHQVGSHSKVTSRFSLQQPSEQDRQRVYQNHEALATMNSRHNSAETINLSGWRLSTTEGDIFSHHANQPPSDNVQKSIHTSAKATPNSEDLSNRQYQNVHRVPHPGRVSPTKRVQHSPMKMLPEKYYSVAPPQALKKYRASVNSTPPSSPDDDGFVPPEMVPDDSIAPFNECDEYEHNESYEDASTTELSMKVVGDSLVVHKVSSGTGNSTSSPFSPQADNTGYYQNLAFMQGSSKVSAVTDLPDGAPQEISTDSQSTEVHVGASSSKGSGDGHYYTNVEFATKKTPEKMGRKLSEDSNCVNSLRKDRKISAPSGPSTQRIEAQVSGIESESPRLVLSVPTLRNSHSNYELSKAGVSKSSQSTVENRAILDYYNIMVPHLPANSASSGQDIGLKNRFGNAEHNTKAKDRSSDPVMDTVGISEAVQPKDQFGHNSSHNRGDNLQGAAKPFDTKFLMSPKTSSQFKGGDYDTLAPITIEHKSPIVSPSFPLYDSLIPKGETKSTSSSPEPSSADHLNKAYQYNRKVQLLQHGHKYEYIEVDLSHSDNTESHDGSTSPVRKEHPSSWTVLPSIGKGDKTSVVQQASSNMSSRRKKQLPLQGSTVEVESHPIVNNKINSVSSVNTSKSQPPLLKEINSESSSGCESPKSPRKPQPLPRKDMHFNQSGSELVASINTFIAEQEVAIECGPLNVVDTNYKAKSSSPSRPSQETASRKIKSVHVELTRDDKCDDDIPHAFALPPSYNDNPKEYSIADNEMQPPAIPPRPTMSTKKVSSSPSVQRASEPGIKLPLPQSKITFQPPVPPRPKVLCPPPDNNNVQKYVAVSFNELPSGSSTEYHEVVVHPKSSVTPAVPKNLADSTESRVEYTRVDFNMTYGLGKTIEQVEDRRRGFPDSK